MIKLDNVGQKAVYFTSPYFSKIDLTDAYIKTVKWDKAGQEGYMIVSKNNNPYKIGLFPRVYQGRGNLKNKTEHHLHRMAHTITANLCHVGKGDFKLGYIYNLKQFD